MPDDALTLPPLRLHPQLVSGAPMPMIERRFATYRQAFLVEYLQWLADTELNRADVADSVDAIVSAIQQLHTLHQIERSQQEALVFASKPQTYVGPRSIGEIVDQICKPHQAETHQ